MTKTIEQMEKEILQLKDELGVLSSRKQTQVPDEADLTIILKYMIEERERTNKILGGIAAKINALEQELAEPYVEEPVTYSDPVANRELPISQLDADILSFIQSKEMVCADQVKAVMGYKGRNAACTRLSKLYKQGLLERFQLGHKVYYKFDAGKATNILIISPPQ